MKVNTTWDRIIPGEALTTLDVKNNPTTRINVGSAFIIQNATGSNLAVIDAVGNMDMSKIAKSNNKCGNF